MNSWINLRMLKNDVRESLLFLIIWKIKILTIWTTEQPPDRENVSTIQLDEN